MTSKFPTRAFATTSNGGLLNVLKNDCRISAAYDRKSGAPQPPAYDFGAIWDTGATNSVITQNVVDKCALTPTGMVQVHTVGGSSMSETFLVDLWLPNRVILPNVRVTKGALTGADIIVGMDVISKGDFPITNFNGLTKFTFRIPSLLHLDFVQELRVSQAKPAVALPDRAERRRQKFGRP